MKIPQRKGLLSTMKYFVRDNATCEANKVGNLTCNSL